MSYETDKYAPQPGESATVVHQKHLQLIADQRADNLKSHPHVAPPHAAKLDEHPAAPPAVHPEAHQPK